MLDVVAISGRDQDVAARAAGKISAKVESRIIRIIEQKQPLLVLSSKPIKSILPRGPDRFGESDVPEVGLYGLRCAGINKIDI